MALAKKVKGFSVELQKKALSSALSGAKWFINTQVDNEGQPTKSANFGRYAYNAHINSDYRTFGIDWTSARALFILLSAYQATKDKIYMESVKKGMLYAYSLQCMDPRDKLVYGAFREETPESDWIFPRDGIELADAFLQYYMITKDKEALYRAELFLDWFIRETFFKMKDGKPWIYRRVDFGARVKDSNIASCEGGNTMALAHAYKLTGKAKYKIALKKIIDSQIHLYHKSPGPFSDKLKEKDGNHHISKDGNIDNDDGAGIGLLCAYDIFKDKKYLEHAISLGEYHVSKGGKYSFICASPAATVFLVELYRFTGDKKVLEACIKNTKGIFKLQHKNKKRKYCDGGFIGEDEGGINYVPGFSPKPEEMVTTRTTAFSCLTLFKIAGKAWPLGYSVI